MEHHLGTLVTVNAGPIGRCRSECFGVAAREPQVSMTTHAVRAGSYGT
jgi:hypothetical protein